MKTPDTRRTLEERLADEERRALGELREDLARVGRGVPGAAELVRVTREHPVLVTALGAALGAVLVPSLIDLGRSAAPLARGLAGRGLRASLLRAWFHGDPG